MSCYKIYYRADGTKLMRPVGSAEEYRQLRHSLYQINMVAHARRGEKVMNKKEVLVEAKTMLLQMNYSCLPNDDGTLKDSTRPSMSVGMDIDLHRTDFPTDEAFQTALTEMPQRILAQKDELHLLMLERSAGSTDKQGLPKAGFHLAFRRRPELSQVENLKWASALLGVPFDEGAKDITRVFFTTTASEEDLLYLDAELFCNEECKNAKMQECKDEATAQHNSQFSILNYRASRMQNQACLSSAEAQPIINKVNSQSLNYHGIPYADIIAKYWELFNSGKEPIDGDRNVKTFELAKTLRHICNYSQEMLEQVIPIYDGFPVDEWRATIGNALKAERSGMPYELRRVLAEIGRERKFRAAGGTKDTPPQRPQKLPRLLELLTSKVPEIYKSMVAEAVFPALGAHLHGVQFRYTDNVLHEPTFMHLLIAQQGSGKGRIKDPIDCINEDIRLRDTPSRMREQEWKRKNPVGKTRAKDPRPTDICIQLVIDNLTDAVFNQRVIDAHQNGERFIYTIVDEVERLCKVTSSGRVDDVSVLIRKAFDNALHGQERVGSESVTGIAPLRWNWNASSTPQNAISFFRRAVNDGTLSRLNISTIVRPEKEEGEKNHAPVVGLYDDDFKAELKPYIERLNSACGEVECPQATKLALRLQEELDERADLFESEAYRILSYRAIVIGFLKAMVLYVADGQRWSRTIEEYVEWAVQMDLWCKMRYFGRQLEEQLEKEKMAVNASPQNLLALLPDVFTVDDYRLMRQQQGRRGDGGSTLRMWKKRGYVDYDEDTQRWCKTALYSTKEG